MTPRPEAIQLPAHIDSMLVKGVRQAGLHYRSGDPGRGEFAFVRLGLKVARAVGDQPSVEVLSDLRYVEYGNAPLLQEVPQ